MSLANLITGARFLFIPLLFWSVLQDSVVLVSIALATLFLIIIGDMIDGYVARKRHEITKIGSFLDPITNKIVVYGLLIIHISGFNLLLFPLLIFVARDVIVNICRFYITKNAIVVQRYLFRRPMIAFQYALVGLLVINQLLQTLNVVTVKSGAFMGILALILIGLSMLAAIGSIIWQLYFTIRGVKKSIVSGKKIPKEEMVILANRRSSGYRDRYRRRLLKTFARRRGIKIYYLPRKKNMYSGIEKKIGKVKNIIIAGGDGSFESALAYTPFAKKRLGFFPFGAGNAYYSYFYKGNRFNYLRSRFPFHEMPLDVLEVSWEKGKFQTGLFVAGLDAEVIRLVGNKHGFVGYFSAGWQAFWKCKSDYNITCLIDGKKKTWKNCMAVTLAKIPYFGYGIRGLAGEVPPNDGQVHGLAYVNSHFSLSNRFIRLWALILVHIGQAKPPLFSFSGKKIVVKSEVPIPIQAGGEFLGFSQKFTVKVVRKQNVLVI
ncbi:hypothetical protein HOI26_00290 [Candidatus Woesearchaeota archaeon]|jgi:CDP-diacylglycerol---glycerol-3-phosphate 3-phosphatidyltransferase|nr:hypothetical protein [Candidatus Woesearchaeota archaeon]